MSNYFICAFWELVYFILLAIYFPVFKETLLIAGTLMMLLAGWYYGLKGTFFGFFIHIGGNVLVLKAIGMPPEQVNITLMPAALFIVIAFGLCATVIKSSREKLAQASASLQSEFERRSSQLDQLAQTLINKDETDRVRIGQDLHDGVGQHLTGMLLHCGALQASLSSQHHEKEALMMQDTLLRIQKNLQQVRQLSRTLFPIRILETGFDIAMEELISYFESTHGLKFTIEFQDLIETLTPQVSLQLYRITHQTVQNAHQHGHAQHIHIELQAHAEDMHLVIENDGTPLPVPLSLGMGLELAQYRARSIHSTLQLEQITPHTVRMTCVMQKWLHP